MLPGLRYVQVTVLHPSERAQVGHHDIRASATPANVLARLRAEEDALLRREAFKEELRHFAESVRSGRKPTASAEDGRADAAWLLRIRQARTPRSVEEPRVSPGA